MNSTVSFKITNNIGRNLIHRFSPPIIFLPTYTHLQLPTHLYARLHTYLGVGVVVDIGVGEYAGGCRWTEGRDGVPILFIILKPDYGVHYSSKTAYGIHSSQT